MSNQRPAKTYRAAAPTDGRIDLREFVDFMERCANVLDREGQEDSAFYFEQIAEYVKSNPHKALKEDAGRILGI